MVAETSSKPISVTLRVWRQAGPNQPGQFVEYQAKDLNPNMSLLEMLDVVNDALEQKGEEPIAFAHDCREGICGTCSLIQACCTRVSSPPARPTCAALPTARRS